MENRYLDETALKEMIRRIMAGTDEESREDQGVLRDIFPSFHAYVDAVVHGETELAMNPQTEGQAYLDIVKAYDQARHSCHETAIISARVLNRLAERYRVQLPFTGDASDRRQVAGFCLEITAMLFRERRMIL